MAENVGEGFGEVTAFRAEPCYVYQIPPGNAAGHRAQDWDVDNWFKEVAVRVVTKGEHASVKLEDLGTRELFAEAPLPADLKRFHTVIDPVLDSSRYFAVRVEDTTQGTGAHMFVGVGFRERLQASDFNAALDDHRQFLRRKAEADQIRRGREAAADAAGASAGGSAAGTAAPEKRYSLEPGQTLHISLKKTEGRKEGGRGGGGGGGALRGGRKACAPASRRRRRAPGAAPRPSGPRPTKRHQVRSRVRGGTVRGRLRPPRASRGGRGGGPGRRRWRRRRRRRRRLGRRGRLGGVRHRRAALNPAPAAGGHLHLTPPPPSVERQDPMSAPRSGSSSGRLEGGRAAARER